MLDPLFCMCINKIITYFRMDAPLLDLPNFARMRDCKVFSLLNQIPFFIKCQQFRHVFCFQGLGAKTSFLIQSMCQASIQNNQERYVFFSFRVVLSCQKASYREIRNETEDLIEVSYRYCSCIQNFTVRTTCTMRGSLIKSSQFQTRSHKGVSHETRMLKFMKKRLQITKRIINKISVSRPLTVQKHNPAPHRDVCLVAIR